MDMSVRNMVQKKERERETEGGRKRRRGREVERERVGSLRDRHVGKKYGTKERE
jgi:hypothetical protein